MSEWISVKDRLPESMLQVLGFLKSQNLVMSNKIIVLGHRVEGNWEDPGDFSTGCFF